MKEIAVLAAAAVLGWAPVAQAQDAKAGEGVIKSSGCLK